METIDLFYVLRSKTRRDILKTLMKKEMHISGIAREFNISVAQASKHCKLLEETDLIEKRIFGRTHVLRARPEGLYNFMNYFRQDTQLEVKKGSNIINALTQIAGVNVERADDRGFVTSIDGEEGYYIYEVNGVAPNIPMDRYNIEEDMDLELKKILHVSKKRMKIKIAREPGKYRLRCVTGGEELKRKPFDYYCREHDSLLRTQYQTNMMEPNNNRGIWRYIDWLPVKHPSDYGQKPLTYKSQGLAEELGLENLYVSFNGYWPERGVAMETCTFKELEGAVTQQLAREQGIETLVVASAGNTAKAFASTAQEGGPKAVLIVPEKCLCGTHLPHYDETLVKTLILDDGDYSDSIELAMRISRLRHLTYEGGARNIARRDGLALVMVDAALEMGRLPRHYFQAVGSGTGAIAAYEASLRLIEDGRFGVDLPRFHLSQNLPLAPMHSAWRAGRREIDHERDIPKADNVLDLVYARVLSNRYPPYGVGGGVYEMLQDTGGDIHGVTAREARKAKTLFEHLEGIDILPAAAVAVASLDKAASEKRIGVKDHVLLNITGGGQRRLAKDKKLDIIKPMMSLSKEMSDREILELEL